MDRSYKNKVGDLSISRLTICDCDNPGELTDPCKICGAEPRPFTEAELNKYREEVEARYKYINNIGWNLIHKRANLKRIQYNLRKSEANCVCTATSRCGYHS